MSYVGYILYMEKHIFVIVPKIQSNEYRLIYFDCIYKDFFKIKSYMDDKGVHICRHPVKMCLIKQTHFNYKNCRRNFKRFSVFL